MHEADYNAISEIYANTRWPLPWILNAISEKVRPNSDLLDVGCGTGDYAYALMETHRDCNFFGVDLSTGMLRFASSRCAKGHWTLADLDKPLPYKPEAFHLAFSVNVMHHLANHGLLFQQLYRVLKRGGSALILTDSDQDIRERSQSDYFPETLNFNLARYPKISYLRECAELAHLQLLEQKQLSGLLEIDEKFMRVLERKALSELRAISPAAFERGMERVREDRTKGALWRTQITMLLFIKE